MLAYLLFCEAPPLLIASDRLFHSMGALIGRLGPVGKLRPLSVEGLLCVLVLRVVVTACDERKKIFEHFYLTRSN